jgi:hypothetical protein
MRIALAILLASPALAENNQSLDWILANSGAGLRVDEVGTMAVRGTEMIGVDSLTFSPSNNWPWFDVPEGPARVVALFDPVEQTYSKAAILFSTIPPVCGEEVGGMPVDTGTGAFLDRHAAAALDVLAAGMGSTCNLYDCFMAEQVPEARFAKMIRLPDGASFPAFSTGYGDGVYPVYLLRDAEGAPTAAFADFLGVAPDYAWLTPPDCPKPDS